MRFLLDQDVYALTAHFLRGLGHDVVTAAQLGLSQATDEHLLQEAAGEGRILVTRDRDYGKLVFSRSIGTGVIYMRFAPIQMQQIHDELWRLFEQHTEEELINSFVVVEPDRHRIRPTR